MNHIKSLHKLILYKDFYSIMSDKLSNRHETELSNILARFDVPKSRSIIKVLAYWCKYDVGNFV